MKITTYTTGGLQFSDTVKEFILDFARQGFVLDGEFFDFAQTDALIRLKLEDET